MSLPFLPAIGPVSLLLLCACLLSTAAICIVYRMRMTPAERERRRRQHLSLRGRYRDGVITDVQGDTLYYSYSMNGVSYTASQDVSSLGAYLPADRGKLVGPVTLRYSNNNPANSIVVSETWSGLRCGREPARTGGETVGAASPG